MDFAKKDRSEGRTCGQENSRVVLDAECLFDNATRPTRRMVIVPLTLVSLETALNSFKADTALSVKQAVSDKEVATYNGQKLRKQASDIRSYRIEKVIGSRWVYKFSVDDFHRRRVIILGGSNYPESSSVVPSPPFSGSKAFM